MKKNELLRLLEKTGDNFKILKEGNNIAIVNPKMFLITKINKIPELEIFEDKIINIKTKLLAKDNRIGEKVDLETIKRFINIQTKFYICRNFCDALDVISKNGLYIKSSDDLNFYNILLYILDNSDKILVGFVRNAVIIINYETILVLACINDKELMQFETIELNILEKYENDKNNVYYTI